MGLRQRHDVATERYDGVGGIYGGAWTGPVFVLTGRPGDQPGEGVTFISGSIDDAVANTEEAADGGDIEVFGATIAAQVLEAGLLDEVVVHVAPLLLGDGGFTARLAPPPLTSSAWRRRCRASSRRCASASSASGSAPPRRHRPFPKRNLRVALGCRHARPIRGRHWAGRPGLRGTQLFHRVALDRVGRAVAAAMQAAPEGRWACNVADPQTSPSAGSPV